mmetsp:Transcript_10320/g.38308  ORF Transcript_10320/g.38308 Transcript_10320/m.38308 type:complete len:442 (-) Transcript_10320:3423-4748(-)
MPKKSPPKITTAVLLSSLSKQDSHTSSPSSSTSPDSNASPTSATSMRGKGASSKRRRASRPNVRRACSGCKKAHACCNPITKENGELTCKRCSKKGVPCDLRPDDIIVASSDVLNSVNPKLVENLSQTLERQSALINQLMEQNQVLTNSLLAKSAQPQQSVSTPNGNPSRASSLGLSNGMSALLPLAPQEFHKQIIPNDFVRYFKTDTPVAMFTPPDSLDAKPFSFFFRYGNESFCKMMGMSCQEMISKGVTMTHQPLTPLNNDLSRQDQVSHFLQNILRQTMHFIQNLDFFTWSFDERHSSSNRFYRVYYTMEYGTLYTKYVEKDSWSNYLCFGPIAMPETMSTRALLTEKELQSNMERFQQCAQQVTLWFLANTQQTKLMYSRDDESFASRFVGGHAHSMMTPSMSTAFADHPMTAPGHMENPASLNEAPGGFEFEWND